MKTFRMALGLVAAVCAFGALAAPALAKKTHEHPEVLGKFVASTEKGAPIPESGLIAKGTGDVEDIDLAEGWVNIPETIKPNEFTAEEPSCKKVTSSGLVTESRSDTLYQRISFKGCWGIAHGGTAKHGFQGVKMKPFHIGIEFHSNHYVETGEGEVASAEIEQTSIFVTPKGYSCKIEVPAQTVPVKAIKQPESEFEVVTYETETESEPLKKFPSGFQEKLDIDMELSKVKAKLVEAPHCYPEGVKESTGKIDVELEEVGIKNANLGFRDKEEVEAEEA